MDKLLSISKTANILGVSYETLRNWDRGGKLKPIKTAGGHRRYKESDINTIFGTVKDEESLNLPVVATYGRVSSHEQKQKGDLDRQCQRLSEYCAKKKYKVDYIIKDVGSGLSDTRAGLNKLFDLVIGRKVNKVVVEHKDRLTRFQFNIFAKFFTSYGVDIEYIEGQDNSDEAELTNDIMMLMAVFSGRIHGRRSAKRRKESKEAKKNENSKINKV
jgi:putative resolvase